MAPVQDESIRPFRSPAGVRSLKTMRPAEVAATLADDARLIVPVGTCEAYADALPMGCATIVVDRLADDLSAEFGVLRAPTMEYGVNAEGAYPGRVSLHKKTLHRTLNNMLASWETHGVSEFILLTAHGFDPHQEALGTVSTASARVRVIDIFAVNLSDLFGASSDEPQDAPPGTDADAATGAHVPRRARDASGRLRRHDDERGPAFRALLEHLAPDLVEAPTSDGAALGRTMYERIRARISERIFLAPAPFE